MSDENQPQRIQPSVDPELVKLATKFIENQARELALRQQQMEKAYQYANDALQLDFQDREKERIHEAAIQKQRYWYLGGVSLLLAGFLLLTLYLDKESARGLISIVGTLVAVAVGGWLRQLWKNDT